MTLRRVHIMLDERELAEFEALWPLANRSEIIRIFVQRGLEREKRKRIERSGED